RGRMHFFRSLTRLLESSSTAERSTAWRRRLPLLVFSLHAVRAPETVSHDDDKHICTALIPIAADAPQRLTAKHVGTRRHHGICLFSSTASKNKAGALSWHSAAPAHPENAYRSAPVTSGYGSAHHAMEIPGRRCVVMSSVAETPRIGQEGARAVRPALGRRPLHMVTASLIVPMIAAALVVLH